MRGTVFFVRGNVRIQITTDEKIYFYLIDKKTLLPELENVMLNYLQCSSLMFGPRVRYGIAFKANQADISIFTRKSFHNFKVCIDTNTFEGAVGCELKSIGAYALAE